MTSRGETRIVRWQPEIGPAHRMVFEPQSEGDWLREMQVWAGEETGWRVLGAELVEDVEFEMPASDAETGP